MSEKKNYVGGVQGAMRDRGKAWSPDLGSGEQARGRWFHLQGEKLGL